VYVLRAQPSRIHLDKLSRSLGLEYETRSEMTGPLRDHLEGVIDWIELERRHIVGQADTWVAKVFKD
jgi:hypothetical protein